MLDTAIQYEDAHNANFDLSSRPFTVVLYFRVGLSIYLRQPHLRMKQLDRFYAILIFFMF